MDVENRIQVTDREGWHRDFVLQKPLIYIGSDARNDIVLDASRGGGVAARHLQLIAAPGNKPGYRAVNLGGAEIPLDESGDRALVPGSAVQIADGERLHVGDFELVFLLGARTALPAVSVTSAGATGLSQGEGSSASISLAVSLPRKQLEPTSPLDGMICVRNAGNMPGAQFKLELEGIEPDCYEMGPGPILFPNVEKDVFLRLHHPQRPGLPPGPHEIRVCAMAPDAYPGESVTVSREIEILPFHHHTLRLLAVD